MNSRKIALMIFGVFILLNTALSTQSALAQDICTSMDTSGCWRRYYGPGTNPDGDPGQVFYRLLRVCKDGIQIGVASDAIDEYFVYAMQFNAVKIPKIRKVIDMTKITMEPIPGGEIIMTQAENGTGDPFEATIYAKKFINLGYLQDPTAAYGSTVFLEDLGYGNSNGIGLGIGKPLENCYLFPARLPPNGTTVKPTVICVQKPTIPYFIVRFGYQNTTAYDAIIPGGPHNNFTTNGMFQSLRTNTPTYFPVGQSVNLTIKSTDGFEIKWKLGMTTVTASKKTLAVCK